MTMRILPPSTIGIIRVGQLGQMMALSAIAQGYRVAVVDPFIKLAYHDAMAVAQFVELWRKTV